MQEDMERLNEEARELWLQILEAFRPTAERVMRWLETSEGDEE